MAARLTSTQIPVPEWLQPVVKRAHQPPVPRPQPGTYGNTAVAEAAQSVEAPAHHWSSSDTGTLPWRDRHPRYPRSASASIGTKPRLQSTAGATGPLLPSRTDPPSPQQDRAAKRAGRRYLPTPQYCLDSITAPPQAAPAGNLGNPAPSTGRGSTQHHTTVATQPEASAQPGEAPGATNPQSTANPSPMRHQAPRNPTPAHGRHHPLTPPQADPEPCPHLGSPAQPTGPVPPTSPGPRARPRPRLRRAPPPRAPVHQQGRSATGPNQRCHSRRDQHWPNPWEGRATR